jgi:hypothetical protein
MTLSDDVGGPAATESGKLNRDAGRFNAGQRRNAVEYLLLKSAQLAFSCVPAASRVEFKRENILRIKSDVGICQLIRLELITRSGEQDRRQCDFRDHQSTAQAFALPFTRSRRCCLSGLL